MFNIFVLRNRFEIRTAKDPGDPNYTNAKKELLFVRYAINKLLNKVT